MRARGPRTATLAGRLGVDGTLLGMVVVLAALVAIAWARGGRELVDEGLGGGAALLARYALLFAVAFLVAGLAEKLVPRAWVSRALGEGSGWRGLLLATSAGILTPSGPFISFPLAKALLGAGASPAAVVTYVAAWMLLAAHRFFIWELPFLGTRMALVRWGVCLALPPLAGLATRAALGAR